MNPFSFHNPYGGTRWRITTRGVEVEGIGIERTSGDPLTIIRIWETYRTFIEKAAFRFSVPVEYILATIAVETQGKPNAVRLEPGYISDEKTPHRVSVGLTQTLLSTASTAMGIHVTREWLLDPENAILAGTKYIRMQSTHSLLDGPMVFAAYNAGGVYLQNGATNRWKMRQFPIGTSQHCDRALKWLNDAVFATLGGEIAIRGWAWYLRALISKTLV